MQAFAFALKLQSKDFYMIPQYTTKPSRLKDFSKSTNKTFLAHSAFFTRFNKAYLAYLVIFCLNQTKLVDRGSDKNMTSTFLVGGTVFVLCQV